MFVNTATIARLVVHTYYNDSHSQGDTDKWQVR